MSDPRMRAALQFNPSDRNPSKREIAAMEALHMATGVSGIDLSPKDYQTFLFYIQQAMNEERKATLIELQMEFGGMQEDFKKAANCLNEVVEIAKKAGAHD